ncbi:uncharacterized protein LOC118784996 [Megalops cyprinoides]|uniref:uncharacterized protein LOC118784996 n=1 Tax=Megalops cyprinoides TaxID=118141 RepID=UPI001864F47C|nr:uncharacterized protein LOC118784996 [Megalops cyprinoides]
MVINRDIDRAPLSLILPHLYLGAEADVTQDCLSSQGITYVLSVSRCCPQPAFLPKSQYLRIPINDSLRDDLLPWIPEALQFIDGAVSLGCSVLVHCAAGVSRSPALAVAYVMYRLGLDLDDAYRFVKERRPSISPNFNFLGQLQYFQGALAQQNTGTKTNAPHIHIPAAGPCCTNKGICYTPAFPSPSNQDTHDALKDSFLTKDCTEEITQCTHCDYSNHISFNHSCLQGAEMSTTHTVTKNPHQEKPSATELTLSLSDRLRALTLSLNHTETQSSSCVLGGNQDSLKSIQSKPFQKPTVLKLASGSTSSSDRRKALTLSLIPMGADPNMYQKVGLENNHIKSNQGLDHTNRDCSSNTDERRAEAVSTNKKRLDKMSLPNVLSVRSGNSLRETRQCGQKKQENENNKSSCKSKTQNKGEGKSGYCHISQHSRESDHFSSSHEQGRESWSPATSAMIQPKKGCNSTGGHQEAPDGYCASAVEAVEGVNLEQTSLSPINLSVHKLLNWGEKLLLGALLGPRIKVGQAALPYRC